MPALLGPKVLLETSVLILGFQSDAEKQALYTELRSHSQTYTLFFVIYEFKKGYLRALVDLYELIKLEEDVGRAYDRWGQSFKTRGLKHGYSLTSLLMRQPGPIDFSNYKEALGRIEAIIINVSNTFDIYVKRTVGAFGSNELVKYKINTSKDFPTFLDICNKNKTIDQVDFWKKAERSLKAIIGDAEYERNYKKMHGKLVKILNDPIKSDMVTLNQGVGDAIITIDSRAGQQIISFDKIFPFLCKPLGKESVVVKNWLTPPKTS